jgi:hypothetical protein
VLQWPGSEGEHVIGGDRLAEALEGECAGSLAQEVFDLELEVGKGFWGE